MQNTTQTPAVVTDQQTPKKELPTPKDSADNKQPKQAPQVTVNLLEEREEVDG